MGGNRSCSRGRAKDRPFIQRTLATSPPLAHGDALSGGSGRGPAISARDALAGLILLVRHEIQGISVGIDWSKG